MLKRYAKDSIAAYIFLLPVIVGTLLFTAYPIGMSLFYSFTDLKAGAYPSQMTFENYANLFTGYEARSFFRSLGLTMLYVVSSTVINIVLSYALALFLKKNIRGVRVIRLLCYLPVLIPGIASGLIWREVFAYDGSSVSAYGVINTALHNMGLKPLTFFESADTAMLTLLFSGLWGIGGGMIMWLAALGNIPEDLYESAELDGAGYFKKLFAITIPLTTSMLFYNLVTSLISGLQIFNTFATYGVGAGDSLYFVAIRIYLTAFPGDLGIPAQGMACAMSWILFVIIGALTLVMFKTNNWVKYNDD